MKNMQENKLFHKLLKQTLIKEGQWLSDQYRGAPTEEESVNYTKKRLSEEGLKFKIYKVSQSVGIPGATEVYFYYKNEYGESERNSMAVWFRKDGELYGEW